MLCYCQKTNKIFNKGDSEDFGSCAIARRPSPNATTTDEQNTNRSGAGEPLLFYTESIESYFIVLFGLFKNSNVVCPVTAAAAIAASHWPTGLPLSRTCPPDYPTAHRSYTCSLPSFECNRQSGILLVVHIIVIKIRFVVAAARWSARDRFSPPSSRSRVRVICKIRHSRNSVFIFFLLQLF